MHERVQVAVVMQRLPVLSRALGVGTGLSVAQLGRGREHLVLPLAHLGDCCHIEGPGLLKGLLRRSRHRFSAFLLRHTRIFVSVVALVPVEHHRHHGSAGARPSLEQANRVPHHYGRVTIAKRLIKVICLQQAYPKLRRAQHTDSTRTAALPVASHSRTPRP